MNFEKFIASRLSMDKTIDNHLSVLMSRISIASVAMSTMVMVCAIAILTGFKENIQNTLIGFNAHIRISNYDTNYSFETNPINTNLKVFDSVKALTQVEHIQRYALKGGIISTGEETQGAVLKGVDTDFDWSFFQKNLTQGKIFEVNDTATSKMVLISETLASMLKLKLGDSFEIYFVQDPIRVRKFTISGLFSTFYEDFDRTFLLCDIKHIQKLNSWDKNQASGIEVYLKDYKHIKEGLYGIQDMVAYRVFPDGSQLDVSTIWDNFPHLFNWMKLQDMNVIVILVLMLLVAIFNLVSSLLIMLFEKISMIGILKSLGMKDSSIRNIFFIRSAGIAIRGMILGNILGISLCLIQARFGLIRLNPENYHLDRVPISLSVSWILILNISVFIVIQMTQLFPSLIISRMSPDKIIRMK